MNKQLRKDVKRDSFPCFFEMDKPVSDWWEAMGGREGQEASAKKAFAEYQNLSQRLKGAEGVSYEEFLLRAGMMLRFFMPAAKKGNRGKGWNAWVSAMKERFEFSRLEAEAEAKCVFYGIDSVFAMS